MSHRTSWALGLEICSIGLPGPWVLKYVPSDFLGLTISDAWTSWASLECVAKIRVVFQVECCFTGPFSVRSFNGSLPALVAQLDRASDYGSEGWGFESLRARCKYPGRLAFMEYSLPGGSFVPTLVPTANPKGEKGK